MSRPLYETSRDLQRESAVAAAVTLRFGAPHRKLAARYPLDYAFTRGKKVIALAEIKCRNNALCRYPTLMVSLLKLLTARDISKATGIPSFLIVGWTDCIGAVNVDSIEMGVSIGGREDRNDPGDIELVVHIPINRFVLVE